MRRKNIFIFIGLAVILLLGAGLWWLTSTIQEKGLLRLMPEEKAKVKMGQVGYGWSTKDEAREAVSEAVETMQERLEGRIPQYVLLWYTTGYPPEELQAALREMLGPDIPIQGSSSATGVMTPDGYHIGQKGSLAILGISSEKVVMGVAGADLDEMTAREAGRKAVKEAMFRAGRDDKPRFIYLTATPGQEEEILLGIEEVVGADVPIMGGSSGDETLSGQWSQMTNEEVYRQGLVLSVLYTDLKIGMAQELGYMQTVAQGVITKAQERNILELDNRQATLVYNEWSGGYFEQELKEGGNILAKAAFYPLATVVQGIAGENYLYLYQPAIINLLDKSMTTLARVAPGEKVQLLHGNWEWLINRAQTTAKRAMLSGGIGRDEALFAYYTFSAGTALAIPEPERARIPRLLREEIGNIPFVGGFTLGNQIFLPGAGNRHTNAVNALAVFK